MQPVQIDLDLTPMRGCQSPTASYLSYAYPYPSASELNALSDSTLTRQTQCSTCIVREADLTHLSYPLSS